MVKPGLTHVQTRAPPHKQRFTGPGPPATRPAGPPHTPPHNSSVTASNDGGAVTGAGPPLRKVCPIAGAPPTAVCCPWWQLPFGGTRSRSQRGGVGGATTGCGAKSTREKAPCAPRGRGAPPAGTPPKAARLAQCSMSRRCQANLGAPPAGPRTGRWVSGPAAAQLPSGAAPPFFARRRSVQQNRLVPSAGGGGGA